MPDNFYEKMLDEKFSSIHQKMDIQFDNLHKTLQNIENQTTKTNGKVIKLEEEVKELNIKELTHKINCPKQDVFIHLEHSVEALKADVDDKFKDLGFLLRNPKLTISGIVVAVLLILFSYAQLSNYLLIQSAEHKLELLK